MIRQVRAAATTSAACMSPGLGDSGGRCYPELSAPFEQTESRADFGYNWTRPDASLEQPFKWQSAEALGSNPHGENSAHAGSFRTIAPGGYVTIIIPFFSDIYLPQERGLSADVTDFRDHRVTRTNARNANFMCVRISWNGETVHQLCDPNEEVGGVSRTTGVVRAAVEEVWNDLKRAHFLDAASRALVITLHLNANNLGVRSRASLMFELTAAGGVFPSYDVATRVVQSDRLDQARLYNQVPFHASHECTAPPPYAHSSAALIAHC